MRGMWQMSVPTLMAGANWRMGRLRREAVGGGICYGWWLAWRTRDQAGDCVDILFLVRDTSGNIKCIMKFEVVVCQGPLLQVL